MDLRSSTSSGSSSIPSTTTGNSRVARRSYEKWNNKTTLAIANAEGQVELHGLDEATVCLLTPPRRLTHELI